MSCLHYLKSLAIKLATPLMKNAEIAANEL